MKRVFISIVFASFFLSATQAYSEESPLSMKGDQSEEKFQPKRLWHLAGVPAWSAGWLVAHEGMHAIAAQYWNYEILGFYPYPHVYDGKFRWGAVYFACFSRNGPHYENGRVVDGPYFPPCRNNEGFAAIAATPYILDAAVFTVSDLVLTYHVDPDSTAGALLYMGGMVAPWLNYAVGTNLGFGGPDVNLFILGTGAPKWSVTLAVNFVAVAGAWRLYVQGKDVFFDSDKKTKDGGGFVLTPMTDGGSIGLSLGGRW